MGVFKSRSARPGRGGFISRWGKRLGIGLLVGLIGLYFFGGKVVGKIINWQLKSQLAARSNAKLETSGVFYSFPYTVRVDNVHLVVPDTSDARGWGISIARLNLKLAKLPLGGPLVIEYLDIDRPTVKLSAADQPNATPAAAPIPAPALSAGTTASAAQQKLSDLFQLRRITLNDARLEFDPGTRQRPQAPVVWDHLNARMTTTPTTGGTYQFNFTATEPPLADITANGSMDIDALLLSMQKLQINVKCEPGVAAVQLPPAAQAICREFKIGGEVTFNAMATVPFASPLRSVYTATLVLHHGTAKMPSNGHPISPAQFLLSCSNLPVKSPLEFPAQLPAEIPAAPQPVRAWVQDFCIGCGSQTLAIDEGEVLFDRGSGELAVTGFKGKIGAGDGGGLIDNSRLLIAMPFTLTSSARLTDTSAGKQLNLHQLTMNLHCDPGASRYRLPTTQASEKSVVFGGDVNVNIAAKVPLSDPMRALFAARIALANGYGDVTGQKDRITPVRCTLIASNVPAKSWTYVPDSLPEGGLDVPDKRVPMQAWLNGTFINFGRQDFALRDVAGRYDPNSGEWSLSQAAGLLDAGDGFGPLHDANVVLHMPFTIQGAGRLVSNSTGTELDDSSLLTLKLTGASVDVTDKKIPVRDLKGTIRLTPHELESRDISGTSMGGRVSARVEAQWRPMAGPVKRVIPTYFGSCEIDDMDLHKVAMQCTSDQTALATASGALDFWLRCRGMVIPGADPQGPQSVPALITGSGEFDIKRGHFVDIPVLKDILGQFQSGSVTTVGEAAAQYTIADRTINFSQAAASSPVLGVQGHGTIDFAQNVNMIFVAAPLADWGKDIRNTADSNNPIISGLANFAEKAQEVVNKAQEHCYQVQVVGPLSGPAVTPVALPGVGADVSSFFDKMSQSMADNGVLQEIKRRASGE